MNARDNKLQFQDWLNARMVERGLNQSDLARLMGKDRSFVNKLLGGHFGVTFETAKLLAKGLQLPLEEIMEAAGMVQSRTSLDSLLDARIIAMFNELDPEGQEDILAMLQAKIDRKKRKSG